MKKAPPPDPLRENFRRLGLMVIVSLWIEILSVLYVRTTEARRLMGPCFPTGGYMGG